MPRYSADGQVCEIGIEKRHFSPEEISLNSGLSGTEINQKEICMGAFLTHRDNSRWLSFPLAEAI
jgi:hypothetical protein